LSEEREEIASSAAVAALVPKESSGKNWLQLKNYLSLEFNGIIY